MKPECRHTRVPVVVILLYALGYTAGISSAGLGWYYKKQMYLKYLSEEQRFHSAASSYLAVNDEVQLVRKYLPYVIDLNGHGVLGQELRLDWIEFLQQAGKRFGLSSLQFRIGAQTEYHPLNHLNNGNYRIYYSTMHIDMDLLHELDLYAFFTALDRRKMGIYNIISCKFSRLHSEINTGVPEGNIRTECDLYWFNIREQNGGVVNQS